VIIIETYHELVSSQGSWKW